MTTNEQKRREAGAKRVMRALNKIYKAYQEIADDIGHDGGYGDFSELMVLIDRVERDPTAPEYPWLRACEKLLNESGALEGSKTRTVLEAIRTLIAQRDEAEAALAKYRSGLVIPLPTKREQALPQR